MIENTASLTITVGLPGSGKSSWAEWQRKTAPDRVRIVCRDDIRASLGARFEDGDEDLVARIRDYSIDQLLLAGYWVICSDTNLSPRVQRRLEQLAAARNVPFEIEWFTNVSLDTCLYRNEERWLRGDRKVPNSAIVAMHEQFIKKTDTSV